ncbi:MAG TPA: hypothetical protein VMV97_13675 [Sulfuriferula sp.]|nr:hypothetical protein [Sulfuriferula sp.]
MKFETGKEGPISSANKWIKEIVGLPTYLGATLLGMRVTDGQILLVILILLPFIKIYHLVYEQAFPEYQVKGKAWKLLAFFVAQIVLWAAAMLIVRSVIN